MRTLSRVCAVLAVLALALSVGAKDANKPPKAPGEKPKMVAGEVVKVDGTNLVIKTKDKGEVTVATDGSTKVTLDKQPATLADLKAGMKCAVTPDTGTAKKIMAKTAK